MSRIGELIPRETHERIVANARIAVRAEAFANHSQAAHTTDPAYDEDDCDIHDLVTLASGPKPGKEVTPKTQ